MGGGTGPGYYLIVVVVFFFLSFCSFSLMFFVSLFKRLEHDTCCVCFFVSELKVTGAETLLCLSCKTISKVSIWSLFCGFPWKSECFNLNYSLGCPPSSLHHHCTSRLSLSFQLAELLSLFISISCFDASSALGV